MNDDSLSMKFFKLLNTVATHLIPYSVIFHNTIYPDSVNIHIPSAFFY